jgi:hypothetical protein
MKVVKQILIVLAILIHYIILGCVGGQVLLLRNETAKWETQKIEQSIRFNDIWAEYLEVQNIKIRHLKK